MREIKVRVWNTEWKMMMMPKNITNILTDPEGMYGVEFYITVTQSHNEKTQEKDMWEEDCVFMQYTGLKDKNGKEIWEGDIVQVFIRDFGDRHITKRVAEVKYFDDYFGVEIAYRPRLSKFTSHDESICEVIGNVHEHSHLLNK